MSPATAVSDHQLLKKHSPRLVIYPQEPLNRSRPGEKKPGLAGWGDYHPCSAELFLNQVNWRRVKKSFSYNPLRLLKLGRGRPEPTGTPDGINAIRDQVAHVSNQPETADWELDIAPFASQAPSKAWLAYRKLLAEFQECGGATVYGRVVQNWRGKSLQYWYLYLYNDFTNKHEGDWEQVTITLDHDQLPVTVGYSSHLSGNSRCWEHTEKSDGHPVLYVARGSHAGYFSHNGGEHAAKLSFGSKQPRGFGNIVKAAGWGLRKLNDAGLYKKFTDYVPARADDQDGVPVASEGASTDAVPLLSPSLRVWPSVEPEQDDPDWWWMWMQSHWGSSHERVMGGSGPAPPWEIAAAAVRWADPATWLHSLNRDCGTQH